MEKKTIEAQITELREERDYFEKLATDLMEIKKKKDAEIENLKRNK